MSFRRSTPRGQMTRGANSGPAVMLMPAHIRATFMPNPPLPHLPPIHKRRKHPSLTSVTQHLQNNSNIIAKHVKKSKLQESETSKSAKSKDEKRKQKQAKHEEELKPKIEEYRAAQKESGGEYKGMNCYNTLFIGRLSYKVTERKLLREMEVYGPVKDLHIVTEKNLDESAPNDTSKSKGYAFVEFEHEEDMKRAYRAADGIQIEGRNVVVDVERGHTVPSWLPRRLGGGLGGTRLGSKEINVTRPGRYDPSRPDVASNVAQQSGPPPPQPGMRDNGPPMPAPYGYNDGPPMSRGGPPPPYGGPPPHMSHDSGRYGGGSMERKRYRSRSPDRGGYRDRGRRRY